MDEETTALILQLQIEDSNELTQASIGKGKGREGALSDSQLALQLYKEDLERNASIVADRQMTKSIARACQTDGEVISLSQSQEQVAASDREAACRLDGRAVTTGVAPWTVTSEFMDDDLMTKLSALYVSTPGDGQFGVPVDVMETTGCGKDDTPESSSLAASREPPQIPTRKCTACQEQVIFYDTARVPCDHEYCRDCLRDLFRASMTDDSLFPPRCCRQTIAIGSVRIFLTSALVKQYEVKKIEYDTPNRTYCSNPLCSCFIVSENISEGLATCPDCATITCTLCKAVAHDGDCPADTALQQVLQTAQENGWQRCFSCRRLVELDHGCNHMTCPCGAQFCYLCGASWKTCTCAQWNEDRLLTRAEQVVARRRPALAEPQQLQQQRVAAVVQNLRNRHNCDHESWQYVRGQHQCEECFHTLPSYIFECRQCSIQACTRCRRNRL